ncbi:MAG TPA: CBS domain-containing protein [Patescibacteria group bacterium]
MIFLSQLLKKSIYSGDDKYATIIDFGLPTDLHSTEISTVIVKKGKNKLRIPIKNVSYKDHKFSLLNKENLAIVDNRDDFYLVEDLLDKQVIDITGKRMVRVNDVLIKENDALKVTGIDVGFSGVLRRLGLSAINPLKNVTIPWSAVEAFDYQTGDIKIKLGKSNLNNLHPVDLAEILEDAGAKEREGIVEALDAEKAADAIEEANSETQEAILEQLPSAQLKRILEKMQVSEIADVADDVSTETFKRIIKLLSQDKAKRVENLMLFPDDVAGGLMQITFYKVRSDKKVGEIIEKFAREKEIPEVIIVVDEDDEYVGQVAVVSLINVAADTRIKDFITDKSFVYDDDKFTTVFRTFAHSNLRLLPVINANYAVIGVISIDSILQRIEEEEDHDAL